MAETCEFCGTGHYAHTRLVCGAQVARLEAAAAAKDAALEHWFPERLKTRLDGEQECEWCLQLVSLNPHAEDCPRAALSDGGEGWLPLEVRELVTTVLQCSNCAVCSQKARAALDALEVNE